MLLRNRTVWGAIRLLLGFGLLGLLLGQADWAVISALLREAHWQPLPLFLLTLVAFIGISTLQWQVLVLHSDSSFWSLTALYFVGSFFNNFLPTSFGGDVVRVYGLTQICGSVEKALSSVILSRVLGLVGLIITSAIAIVTYVVIGQADWTVLTLGIGSSAIVLIGCVLFFVLIFHPRFQAWLEVLSPVLRCVHLDEKVSSIYRTFAHYRGHPRLLLFSVAWAIVAQLVNSTMILLLGLMLGVQTSWLFYFVFWPLIVMISMLPFSLNGVGLREWGFVTLFAMVGVSKEQALSMALSVWLVILFTSVIGGLVYLLGGWRGHLKGATAEHVD